MAMTEAEGRAALVAEVLTWKDTPYHAYGKLKGVGVNCSQFAFCAARNCGLLGAEVVEPKQYTVQLAIHSKEERLISYLLAYGLVEVDEAAVQPGDVVVYKNGASHGHMAIVIAWPQIIHVVKIHGCQLGVVDEGMLAKWSRRYFTFFHPVNVDLSPGTPRKAE